MTARRKRHGAEFKVKVAFEAAKGIKTVNELATEYGVHPTQNSQWKRQLGASAKKLFGNRVRRKRRTTRRRGQRCMRRLSARIWYLSG